MDTDIVKEILRRHDKMKAKRANWDSLWTAVTRFVMPALDTYTHQRPQGGEERSVGLYDAFPQQASYRFAAALDSGLTPSNNYWFNLTTGDQELDEAPGVAADLDSIRNTLWREMYRAPAGFNAQRFEAFSSVGVFGSSALLVEDGERRRGARYRALPMAQTWFGVNSVGQVDTVHHEMKLDGRQMRQHFGTDAPAEASDDDKEFVALWAVYPRADFEPRLSGAPRGLRWRSDYVLLSGSAGRDGKRGLREDPGYSEFPVAVGRYVTAPGEIYGRSPAIIALPDIRMLNAMKWSIIEQANMAVDPPLLTTDDSYMSEFAPVPGSRIPGGLSDDGRPLVAPMQTGSQLVVGLDLVEQIRGQIDEGHLGLYFRALVENPQMTATQALLLAQQQGQLLAPMVSRLQGEMLDTVVRRTAAVLFRQGRFPNIGPELRRHLEKSGQPLGLEYQSPMTRAAAAGDAIAVARTLEAIAPMAQIDPTVLDEFDMRGMARIVARANGLPPSGLKDREAQEASDAATIEQAQMADILSVAPVAAQTAKTLAETQKIMGSAPNVPQG